MARAQIRFFCFEFLNSKSNGIYRMKKHHTTTTKQSERKCQFDPDGVNESSPRARIWVSNCILAD